MANVNTKYADYEQNYVNKGYIIKFLHIPSGNEVSFKGMITQLGDKYNPEWSKEKVYGRNDPIANFKGTDRTMSIGWSVVAASIEEAKSNLSKVSLLTTFLYPSYNGDQGATTIAAAPLLRLWFTNLIASVGKEDDKKGLVGFIDGSFGVDYVLDEEFYDLPSGILYPKDIKLSCNFVVLHTHKLGWSTNKEIRQGNFPYGVSLKDAGYKMQGQKTNGMGGPMLMDNQKTAQEQKILSTSSGKGGTIQGSGGKGNK